MSSRPELLRCAGSAAALLATVSLCACGKSDLQSTALERSHPSQSGDGAGAASAPRPKPARPSRPAAEHVAVPLPLTAARATGFAQAVTLHRVDMPGSAPSAKSKTPPSQEREASKCGGRGTRAIGGGRSPDFQRGAGLNRESISSSVDVLRAASAVRSDLSYAASRAGLKCYSKVLGKSLSAEQDSHVKLLGVRVGHLRMPVGSEQASGIRIAARVGITGTGVTVRLFVDALSLPYGPAELDLYSTSFVQPVAERTQRELLALLRARAQSHRL